MAKDKAGMTPAPRKNTPKKPATPAKKVEGKAAPVAIYALSDPETGEIRYIGKANNPRARLKSHIRDSRRRNTPVYCWIRRLQADGKEPAMSVVEWVDDWMEAEKRQIASHREAGARLLNLAEGGNEPLCSTEQLRLNGINAAKKRDKTIWAAHRQFGQLRLFFNKTGNARYSELMGGITRLFDSLTPQQQLAFGRRIRLGGAA